MKRVFVLTVSTQDWFESLGFREAAVETLPEAKRSGCDGTRKSKVYALSL
jgi:N-acetylglutamate synthase-like GNAT family acetyltransferase